MRAARLLPALVAVLAAALSGTAIAAPVVNGIYDVPNTPSKLTQGSDGNIWVVIGGNALARFTPDGTKTDFPLAGVTGAKGITSGPDGNLWLTATNQLVKVPPTNPAGLTVTAAAGIGPAAIVTGPDGNLWTASGDKVFRISPATPAAPTPFTLTGAAPSARGITSAGGVLWVVDFGGAIVSVTTTGAQVAYTVGGSPQEIAGSPGGQVLYTNPGPTPATQTVGRIIAGGLPQTSPVPLTDPFGVTFGPDGAYWVAQFSAGTLARVTTDGAVTTIGGLPSTNDPREITAGPGNTLWVALEQSKKVARVTGVDPPPAPQPVTPVTPAATPDTTAPVISTLKITPRALRRSRLRTPVATFGLSEAAKVTITVERLTDGRRSGTRCVTRRPLPRGRRCVKATIIGTLKNSAGAGPARASIAVRRGKRALAAGSYRVSVVAVDAAGNASAPVRAPFTISAR